MGGSLYMKLLKHLKVLYIAIQSHFVYLHVHLILVMCIFVCIAMSQPHDEEYLLKQALKLRKGLLLELKAESENINQNKIVSLLKKMYKLPLPLHIVRDTKLGKYDL